jgi:CheY-like chemotaxis protein
MQTGTPERRPADAPARGGMTVIAESAGGPGRARARGAAPSRIPPPPSVLAVVDDPAVRDLLLEIAVDQSYGVYCASGALEALAVFGRERPGAVLVDLDMANAKGLRFLGIFRQLARHDDVLCIAVTTREAPVLATPDVRIVRKPALAGLAEALVAHFGS